MGEGEGGRRKRIEANRRFVRPFGDGGEKWESLLPRGNEGTGGLLQEASCWLELSRSVGGRSDGRTQMMQTPDKMKKCFITI